MQLIKLLTIFLNIEYNANLDKKILDDSKSPEEALEAISDAPMVVDVELVQATSTPPIPGEGSAGLEDKMGEVSL